MFYVESYESRFMRFDNVMPHGLRRETRGPCFAVILTGALAIAQAADGISQSDANSPANVSAAPPEAPRNTLHFNPQDMQAMYLKGQSALMQVGKGSTKEATCLLSLWFTGDGTIHAAQLLKASGFPLIDQACLQSALGRRFEGLPEGHLGGRTFFPIQWVIHPEEADVPQQVKIKLDPSIPQLPARGAMHPLPAYPADALAQHAHGICKMHITVSAAGAVSSIEIIQSTGTGSLDEACKEAVNKSVFVPATDGKEPVSGTTEVAILWRLPRP
jgi:TonB family protein